MELKHINTLDTTEQWVSSKESIWFPSPNLTWVKDEPGGVHTYLSPGKPLPNIDNHIFTNAVTDYDGNNYDAVIIGDQVWTTSNIKSSHLYNGKRIMSTSSPAETNRILSTIGVVFIDNGNYFYNADAITNSISFLPQPWRVPIATDFSHLITTLQSDSRYHTQFIGEKQGTTKSLASQDGWVSSSTRNSPGFSPNTNNRTGFNAKPIGCATAPSSAATNYLLSSGYSVDIACIAFGLCDINHLRFLYTDSVIPPVSFIPTRTIDLYPIRCVYGGTVKQFLKEYNQP